MGKSKSNSPYFKGSTSAAEHLRERQDGAEWANDTTDHTKRMFRNHAKDVFTEMNEDGDKRLDEYNARCQQLGLRPISRPPENFQPSGGRECDVCGEEGSRKKCSKCLCATYCSRYVTSLK